MFGGHGRLAALADTWEYDGTTWMPRTPAASPPERAGHASVFDRARGRTVVFGGSNRSGMLADTWLFDGVVWTRAAPLVSPPPGYGAMAYDVARQRTVLITRTRPNQTWEWDGASWALRANGEPSLFYIDATYDEARARVVVLGGDELEGWETWEWDGTNWAKMPVASPGTGPLVYDLARRQTVALPYRGGGPWTETWVLGALTPPASTPFGTGCPGSRGVPRLLSDEPYIGSDAFSLHLTSVLPETACVFGVALTSGLATIGGCELRLREPVLWLPTGTNAAGGASVALALPLDPGALGASMFAQGFVVDPLSSALGLAFSNALRLTIGN